MSMFRNACAGIVVAVSVACGGIVGAAPAAAAPVTETVQGRYLRLVSVADWEAAAQMGVGSTVRWDLTVSVAAPTPGRVEITMSADGTMPLELDVLSCGQAWVGETCPGGAEVLREAWLLPLGDGRQSLASMTDTAVMHLRIEATRVAGDADTYTDLRVYAAGVGDEVAVGPSGAELPATGMSPVLPVVLGCLVVVLIGGGLLLLRRERQRSRRDGTERHP
ncbi:MAG: LPXTG cell wall anchor domain-containing protein [Microbacterium sp.]